MALFYSLRTAPEDGFVVRPVRLAPTHRSLLIRVIAASAPSS
jgi:hypothetical protein